jgi:hypothetical protein
MPDDGTSGAAVVASGLEQQGQRKDKGEGREGRSRREGGEEGREERKEGRRGEEGREGGEEGNAKQKTSRGGKQKKGWAKEGARRSRRRELVIDGG